MKNKFLSRIGQWYTPPYLRKCLTPLKALTLLLVMLMSVNVWGGTKTLIIDGSKLTGTATTAATNYTYGDFTITMSDGAKSQSSSGDNKFADNAILIGKSGKYIYNKTPFGKKITKFELYANKGASTKVSVGVLFSTTAISAYATGTNTYTATLSTVDKVYDCSSKIPEGAKYFWYQVTNANNSQVMFRVTYEEEEEDPTKPSLSVDPEEIDFGTVYQNAEIDAKQVEVTFANLTANDVEAAITGSVFSINKTGSFTSGDKITITPSTADLGEYEETLTLSATGVDDQTVTIKMNVVEAPAPTGTFVKFTGDELKEGDYVICSSTDAMNNTTKDGPRIGYQTITVSNNKIENPDEAVIWHISADPDNAGYWLMYNEAAEKYAAFTSSDGKGTLLDAATDYARWQYTTVSSNKEFSNKGKANKYLRKNSTYGFASYGTGTGSALTLYKKELAPTNEAVTFAAPADGSLVIKNGATPINSGTTIQDGTVLGVEFGMTPAEAYKGVAIKVTKTDGGDDVTSTVYNATKKQITMPRYPITVAVTFTKLYKIEAATVTGGTLSWEDANKAKPTYVEAETLIQALEEADTHYEFKSFDIYKTDDATSKVEDVEGLFEMPAYDVTISGTFEEMQCTALPSAPVLGTPTISYAEGVTLNWTKLDAASGYIVNVWKGTDKIVEDEMITDVNTLSYKITAELGINTEYSYSIAGIGDDETYCMIGNPANESTFTTADYPAVVLTLSENGNPTPVNGKLNTPIELPTTSTQACDGKVFMGWSENAIDGEVGKDQVNLLGETYTFTDPAVLEKTIYAVYAKKVEGDKYFEKVSSAPSDWCGKYLIVYETGNLAMDGSLVTLDAASNTKAVTISDDSKIAWSAEMEAITFTVAYKTGSSTVYSLKSASGKYISGTTATSKASNGIKQADTDKDYEISFSGIELQSKSSDKQMALKYNKSDGQTRFRFYSSGQEAIAMYKYSATIDYSNYCTTCQAAVAAPTFSLAEGEYNEAKTLTLSAAEGDIYYTINDGEETKYTAAIALENRGTYEISAYAKVNDRTSETVTKTYTLNWPYTLDELAASDVADGTTVQVTFENKEITNFYTNSQGKRYGIYVNVQKGGKDVEIYCNKAEHSDSWEVGGKVSSTQAISGTWTYYSGGQQWEFCPNNWDNISYTAPAKITSLKITGDVTNKNYTAGQKLDFTGLAVTGVYSDAIEEDVTADVVWTEVTLTENQPEATATATLNNAKTGNVAVSESKTITGLTVGAKVELSKIEITKEASKKDFFVGRNFNHDGIVVTATYSNGSTSNVTNACDFSTPTLVNKGQETVTITYSEGEGQDKKEVTTSYTINVKYMNLSELVAEDVPTNTSVKVAFSDVEITGFYTNKSSQRTGVYVNVKGKNEKNIELYYNTPSTDLDAWQEGGLISTKNAYVSGTWSYYSNGDVWEITFGSGWDWDANLTYTAPEIYPTEISMSIPTATVKQSKSLDLEASFTPANATVLNNLEWSSDNTQVTVVPSQDKKSAKVTVASDATVGTATITVKVDDKDGNELSATCVITIEEYSVPHYGLYAGDITEGDYIFKADGENYFMNNTVSSNRLTNVADADAPEIVNNVITTDAEAYVWHIAKSGDYWTIQNLANNKYAAGTETKNQAQLLDAGTDDMAKWTITYDEAKDVYTFENLGRSKATSYSDNKYLRNNDGNGWACYASSTGNAITLYKDGFTPAAALTSIEIQGNLDITEYFQGKSVKYDGLTVEGTYSDGDKKTITEGIVWSADPTSFDELGDNISVTITATVQTKNGEITDDAEFTVKVVESQKVSYGLVTSVNTLCDGASIILGAVFGTATDPIYAVNQGFDTKYLAAYRSNTEGSDLEYENEVMLTANASEITLKKVESGWKLMDENNKYIISNDADIALSDKAEEATVWTISIENGVAKIASSSNIIYYNTSSPRFKTYTNKQQEIGIYLKNLVAVRTGLTAGKIATYCEAKGASIYDGAAFFDILNKDANSKNVTLQEADAQLGAGMPYIIEPTHNILKVVFEGDAVTEATNKNGLYGWLNDEKTFDYKVNEGDLYDAYLVSGGRIVHCGTNCTLLKNRAYVVMDYVEYEENAAPVPGRRLMKLGVDRGMPTGFETIMMQKGLNKVIMNNQLFIIRDGKLFNAQGALVK